MGALIASLDMGTTGTRAVVFDDECRPVAQAYVELAQHFPKPGWVEHDPVEMWDGLLECIKGVAGQIDVNDLVAVAITNPRRPTVDFPTTDPHRFRGIRTHSSVVPSTKLPGCRK